MGDQHQSCRKLAVKIKQQFDDPLSRRGIQIARRLIREQNLGLGRECPSNGNPLLFTTGQLVGIMVTALLQTHAAQQLLSFFARQ